MNGQPISLDVLAVWFTTTQRLLLDAKNHGDEKAMRRANIRLENPKFKQLSQDAQDGLMQLHADAMMATGMARP